MRLSERAGGNCRLRCSLSNRCANSGSSPGYWFRSLDHTASGAGLAVTCAKPNEEHTKRLNPIKKGMVKERPDLGHRLFCISPPLRKVQDSRLLGFSDGEICGRRLPRLWLRGVALGLAAQFALRNGHDDAVAAGVLCPVQRLIGELNGLIHRQ